jgi:hypothetical protein
MKVQGICRHCSPSKPSLQRVLHQHEYQYMCATVAAPANVWHARAAARMVAASQQRRYWRGSIIAAFRRMAAALPGSKALAASDTLNPRSALPVNFVAAAPPGYCCQVASAAPSAAYSMAVIDPPSHTRGLWASCRLAPMPLRRRSVPPAHAWPPCRFAAGAMAVAGAAISGMPLRLRSESTLWHALARPSCAILHTE